MKKTFLVRRFALVVLMAGVALHCAGNRAHAQDDVNGQLWLDYHVHYYENEKREWYADGGFRTLTENINWTQVYARPSIRFHRRKWVDVHAGIGLFFTNNRGFDDALELRPWQGAKFRWPVFEAISFSHYFRLEERFTFTPGDNSAALRFRYKLSTRIPLQRATHHQALDPFFLPISIELFSDVGANVDPLFGSRARLDAGLGYISGDNWVWEFHVIAQSSRSGLDEEFETTEYIFRFQLKHLLAARDYRKQQHDLPE